ncbi:MAG: integration host factor subunit beta [Phycisphaerales bacterium]|nr:integration host factor subunit beta [Phycisphaerales bacterium]
MATITKKELIDRIAETSDIRRVVVKQIVQSFLDNIIVELGKGNRLEFRDFGVFEVKSRRPRKAQNPKTLAEVWVPAKRTVKFKIGRMMKQTLVSQVKTPVMPGSADKNALTTAQPSTPAP